MFKFNNNPTAKVVFSGITKNGLEIIVRYPKQGDEYQMLEYINNISKERTFIRLQGEQLTIEEERKFLESMLTNIEKKKGVSLLVFHNKSVIGSAGITMKHMVEQHVGEFGISVAKDYRGQGIGKLLMELVLKEAEELIPELKIVILGAFATNDLAISMYKKQGFIQWGVLPDGMIKDGKHEDHIYMYKRIR